MEDAEQAYREAVTQAYNALGFAGFGSSVPGPHQLRLDQVRLEDIFVRLRLTIEQEEPHHYEQQDKGRTARKPEERQRKQVYPITLAEALNKPLLLVGEPGAGKSTLLCWLAVTFAQSRQRDADRIGPTADVDRLPILLELGRLPSIYLTEDSRQDLDWQVQLPEEVIRQEHFRGTPSKLLQQALKEGRCLLLFDGLDEIANRQARARLAQSLAQVPTLFPGNRVVVGTRPTGLSGGSEEALRSTFQRCQMQRFTPEDLRRFFRFWYALDLTLSPEARLREADALYERIQAAPGTLNLAGTPLLATLLLLIWRKEGTLPERRVDLYERCCRLLVEDWEQSHDVAYRGIFAELGWEQHLRLLAPIAYAIHGQEQRTSISQDALQHLLEEGLQRQKLCPSETAGKEATLFLKTLALRSGLVQFQGDGQYGFPHLTMQEYLTARHLAAQPDPAPINLMMERLHDAWWQEAHLLTIGRLGADREGAAQAATLLHTILHRYHPPSRLLRTSRYEWLRMITPGRWLPKVQFERRLAWLIRREEIFACWGAAECAPGVLPPALLNDLAARAGALARTWFADKERRPLLDAWLSAPGRQLPPQVGESVALALASFLRKRDKDTRKAAAESLGRVTSGLEAAIPALITALRDRDKDVPKAEGFPALSIAEDPGENARLAIAESLGRVTSGQEVVIPALLDILHERDKDARTGWRDPAEVERTSTYDLLQDPELQIRRAAFRSLGQVSHGQRGGILALPDALRNPNADVRMQIAKGLEQLGNGQEAVILALLDVLDNLDNILRSPDASVYEAADVEKAVEMYFGQHNSQRETYIFMWLVGLYEPSENRRYLAFRNLDRIGISQEVLRPILLDATHRYPAKEEGKKSESKEFNAQPVAKGLGWVDNGQEDAVSFLINKLRNPHDSVRRYTLRGMYDFGPISYQEALLSVLVDSLRDPDEGVRQHAAWILGHVGNRQDLVTQALLAALHDPNEKVRRTVVESLGLVGNGQKGVIPGLLDALRDPDALTRSKAAESLGLVASGQEAVIPALLDALRDPGFSGIRSQAAESLGRVGIAQGGVIPALLKALRNGEWAMRRTAAWSLGQMKITDLTQLRQILIALNRRLYDTGYVREAAVGAISQLVSGRALPGSHWKPVHSKLEYSSRRRLVGSLAAAVLGLLALVLGFAWLSGVPPFNSVFAGLGSAIGLIAGLAGLAGVTLRDLVTRWNRNNQKSS